MDFKNRIKHAWNAFMNKDPTPPIELGPSSYYYPERTQGSTRSINDRSMITSIFNRIAMDVASVEILQAKVDERGNYLETMKTPLNECLQISANIDQTGRALIQDAVQRMFNEGCVAIAPIVADDNPNETGTFDIYDIRCGAVTQWYPHKVEVEMYNDKTGSINRLLLDKEIVCIIQNPMYDIMNAPNSLLSRIFKKLALLDVVDNENASNKLNMIIQVPYSTRSQLHQDNATRRRKEIEDQLINNPYGIAYMDINEKLIQLSRPLESNLLEHIKYLMETYKNQLGITDGVLNGTANESEMNNYIKRTVEPICAALCDEMRRKWLTQTARTKGQSIVYYSDPFKLIPISEIAKFADVLSRNEIMTSNELRQKMGMPPSDDPRADELNNANMPDYPTEDQNGGAEGEPEAEQAPVEEEPQTPSEPDGQQEVYFDPKNPKATQLPSRNVSLFGNSSVGNSSEERPAFSLFK